jgi:hypothetical protein
MINYIGGYFVSGNERYSDYFRNQKEFEWCIDRIRNNGACESPDIIIVSSKKVPKYIDEFAEEVKVEGGEINILRKGNKNV